MNNTVKNFSLHETLLFLFNPHNSFEYSKNIAFSLILCILSTIHFLCYASYWLYYRYSRYSDTDVCPPFYTFSYTYTQTLFATYGENVVSLLYWNILWNGDFVSHDCVRTTSISCVLTSSICVLTVHGVLWLPLNCKYANTFFCSRGMLCMWNGRYLV